MKQLVEQLKQQPSFESKPTEDAILKWISDKGLHLGNVMNAFRLAVVGQCTGPHMFDITELLGPAETIARIERAIDTIPVPEA